MKKNDLSIIIVCYNSSYYIEPCLASIFNQVTNVRYEVVVVDNNSTDSTASIVKEKFNQVTLLLSNTNLGFAAGNNRGVEECNSEYILFLNPDTKLEEGSINLMYEEVRQNPKTILVPLQLNYDTGEFLNCGLGLDIFGFPVNEGGGDKFFYGDGAAILMNKHDFIDAGMFDEDLFLIQEDVDLSWKARLMGYGIKQLKSVRIYHKSGHTIDSGNGSSKVFSTSAYRRYYGERNSVRNLLKNYSFYNLLWILPLAVLMSFCEFLLFLVLGKPEVSLSYIRAYYNNIIDFRLVMEKRRWIQKRRMAGDLEILKHMYIGSAKFKLLLEAGVPIIK